MINKAKNEGNAVHEQLWLLATAVRDTCYSAAMTAYEDASTDGLCHEGAWECALAAMRSVKFESVIAKSVTEK